LFVATCNTYLTFNSTCCLLCYF